MKNPVSYFVISLFLVLSQSAMAVGTAPSLEKWQMNMIYHPTASVLERESKGFVHIYDGFDETQVDNILDARFGRIDHMMFTRVKLTDSSGEILLDPETGDELIADDGCD